jgi:hypothetical protein
VSHDRRKYLLEHPGREFVAHAWHNKHLSAGDGVRDGFPFSERHEGVLIAMDDERRSTDCCQLSQP